jgi:hypothetical protein
VKRQYGEAVFHRGGVSEGIDRRLAGLKVHHLSWTRGRDLQPISREYALSREYAPGSQTLLAMTPMELSSGSARVIRPESVAVISGKGRSQFAVGAAGKHKLAIKGPCILCLLV